MIRAFTRWELLLAFALGFLAGAYPAKSDGFVAGNVGAPQGDSPRGANTTRGEP